MSLSIYICKQVNKIFPLPIHPFNLNKDKIKTYSQWQFEKGFDTIKYYMDASNTDKMFQNKIVLDIGCGAGGKTIYYASLGVKKIYGLEILEKYKNEALRLAVEKGLSEKFEFVCQDAAKISFSDDYFDTVIMNDAMEHIDKPIDVLNECYRILKPGGKLYINFPPFNHPFGAHLSDVIGVPWIHLFFSDKTLIEIYKDLVKDLPDGKERIEFRISSDSTGNEYFSYINKMTIKRFKLLIEQSHFKIFFYNEVPLRNILAIPARIPFLKECFVKMVVCILQK